MNKGGMTRKEAVFNLLKENLNEWIDGPDIANPEIGGSEGLKRVRELREDGHSIETRKHPVKKRDIWQYRLVGSGAKLGTWVCSRCGDSTEKRPEEALRKSIAENMAMAPCLKCRKSTVWQFKSR